MHQKNRTIMHIPEFRQKKMASLGKFRLSYWVLLKSLTEITFSSNTKNRVHIVKSFRVVPDTSARILILGICSSEAAYISFRPLSSVFFISHVLITLEQSRFPNTILLM